jgi:hypothetical protein
MRFYVAYLILRTHVSRRSSYGLQFRLPQISLEIFAFLIYSATFSSLAHLPKRVRRTLGESLPHTNPQYLSLTNAIRLLPRHSSHCDTRVLPHAPRNRLSSVVGKSAKNIYIWTRAADHAFSNLHARFATHRNRHFLRGLAGPAPPSRISPNY